MAERPEDLNLPNSVITRIIKEALPDGVNISKDARLAIGKAASVFVLYATSCANNFSMQQKRKTISGVDVLEAMKEMDFERFTAPLKLCLQAYKDQQQGKREKKKVKDQTTPVSEKGDASSEGPVDDADGGDDEDDDVDEEADEASLAMECEDDDGDAAAEQDETPSVLNGETTAPTKNGNHEVCEISDDDSQ